MSPESGLWSGPPLSREAVAAWALAHQREIRTLARKRLTQNTRSVFDSEDIFSSVLRRLDGLAANGNIRPECEAELWALVRQIALNTAVSKTRLIERANALLTEDGPLAYEMVRRLNACGGDDEAALLVHRMHEALESSADRQIFGLLLRGATHRVVAQFLGISEEASRQRWMSIRRRLLKWCREGVSANGVALDGGSMARGSGDGGSDV